MEDGLVHCEPDRDGDDASSAAELDSLRSRLREQQSLYEALVAQHDIVCRFLPDTTVTFANDAYCRHLNSTCEVLIGNPFLNRVPADMHEHLSQLVAGAASGQVQIYERFYVLPDGGVRWLRWHWVPIFGDGGGVTEIQAVGRDITAQKTAQETATRERVLFQSIIDDQSEPILRYTPDGVRTFVNPAYCELRDKPAEELLGKSFYDWHTPEFGTLLKGNLDAIPAGTIQTFEVEDKSTRGGARWMQWSTRAYGDSEGAVIEYQSVGRDITQARRYRLALETLNRVAVDPGLSATERVRSLMSFGSTHFEMEMAVLSRIENDRHVVEQSVAPAECPAPGQRLQWRGGMRGTLTEPFGVESASAESPSPRMTVGDFAAEACFAAPFRVDGEICGAVWFCSRSPARHAFDAMERHFLELLASWIGYHVDADLRRVDLEREIDLRVRAEWLLEQRIGWLERSNAELDQFAYIASHGLQEPLRQIESACSFLADDYTDRLDDDGRALFSIVSRNSMRMRGLVNDLRSYSRIGTAKLDLAPVPLSGVVDAVVDAFGKEIAETGAEITYGTLPVLACDGKLMRLLFENLVSNALKYRGSEAPRIAIEASDLGCCWQFCVTDNGIGIEGSYAEFVFEVFRRLHGKTEYSGTGIGLAICRRIVERHDGLIWLDTQYTGGARFRFEMPCA